MGTQATGRAVATVQVLSGPSISDLSITALENAANPADTLYRLQATAFGVSSESEPFEYRFSYVRTGEGGDLLSFENPQSAIGHGGLQVLQNVDADGQAVGINEVVLADFTFSSSVTGMKKCSQSAIGSPENYTSSLFSCCALRFFKAIPLSQTYRKYMRTSFWAI